MPVVAKAQNVYGILNLQKENNYFCFASGNYNFPLSQFSKRLK